MEMQNGHGNGSARIIWEDASIHEIIQKLAAEEKENKDAFCLVDLGEVAKKYKLWSTLYPQVEAFYPLTCNDDTEVLRVLASQGSGFECVSKDHIEKVLRVGVDPSRILYAHPCKQLSAIKCAANNGVRKMCFDNEGELEKIKRISPDAELVLRIKHSAEGSGFGCQEENIQLLLESAKSKDLKVNGVSFYLESAEIEQFSRAMAVAKRTFDIGTSLGYGMTIVHIGSGFPGSSDANENTTNEKKDVYRKAMEEYFPSDVGVRLLVAPGTFFIKSALYLAANVIAKRATKEDDDTTTYMYYINDGVFGSFMFIDMGEKCSSPVLLEKHDGPEFRSCIVGPTCCDIDILHEDYMLPQLDIGDWMYFSDMGVDSLCLATNFNGMPNPNMRYCAPKDLEF